MLDPAEYEQVKLTKKPWDLRGGMTETSRSILECYDSGWDLNQLCEKFGRSPKNMKNFLALHGRSMAFCKRCGCQLSSRRYCPECEIKVKRKRWVNSRYGITVEETEKLYQEQDGVCAICRNAMPFDEAVVDHDPETGRVRGLFCRNCNSGIGLLQEDINIMSSAIKYLGG